MTSPVDHTDHSSLTSLQLEHLGHQLHNDDTAPNLQTVDRERSKDGQRLEGSGILPTTTIIGAEAKSVTVAQSKPADMVSDANRVHASLAELHDWTGRSQHNIEKDLRDTLATMNSNQIASLNSQYKSSFGTDLASALGADKKLSPVSKEALTIYMKGADHRKPADTLALAEIATRAKNLDMFEEAFRDATPEARAQYLRSGGAAQVKAVFGGLFSNVGARQAMDYVKDGRLSLATEITENTGIFSSNRQAIEHAIGDMTAEQKAQYRRGEEIGSSLSSLARSGRADGVNNAAEDKLSAQQKADLSYYSETHQAITKAGNSKDKAQWQNEIYQSGGGITASGTTSGDHAGTNSVESARAAFNQARDKEYKSNDGLGRLVVSNLWDGTSATATDDLNQYAAAMARAAAAGTTISKADQQARSQELDQSLALLKQSKSAAADTVVDGAITAAAVGGALVTGGSSLALLGAVGAGGAVVKIGAKSAIVGSDYNYTAGNILADGASGAVNTAAMFIGPAQAARVLGLGCRALGPGQTVAAGLATDVILNSTAGALGGVASGAVEGVTVWDKHTSLGDNLARVGNTALVRGATGAVLAGVLSGAIGGGSHLLGAGERAPLAGIKESAPVAVLEGRPLSETAARREIIESKFAPINSEERVALRGQIERELQDVKAVGSDGKPTSAYHSLMSDAKLRPSQKETVLYNLGLVREHLASYRLGGRMHPDPETNWIHTQGEIAKVLEAGRAKGLNANDMEDSLLASMYSDSVKFSAPSPEGTIANFHTHHLDGALAADHSLRLQGFAPDRRERIVEAILAHQIAPPKFMGQLYYMKINGTLEGLIKDGKIGAEEGQKMRDVLSSMTEVDGQGVKRIRQLANVNQAPRITNAEGMQQVAFSPEEQKVFGLSGTDRWILPYDPKADVNFNALSAAEKETQLSRGRIAQNLIDGDGIDNYATSGGASKIVSIRGPKTFFSDPTVWDSIASIDASFKDAYSVLSPEGRRLADRSLAARNQVTARTDGALKDYMDRWLMDAKGLDASTDHIPFYNQALSYPKAGETLNVDQTREIELATEIRQQVVDFLRRDHRTDRSLPGDFAPVRMPMSVR